MYKLLKIIIKMDIDGMVGLLDLDLCDVDIKFLLNINLDIRNNGMSCDALIEYGSEGQFSKGYRRLYDLYDIMNCVISLNNGVKLDFNDLKILKKKDYSKYVLFISVLIVLFQVFSDGNHRTAQMYYYKKTGDKLSDNIMKKINVLLSSFEYISFRMSLNTYSDLNVLSSLLFLVCDKCR